MWETYLPTILINGNAYRLPIEVIDLLNTMGNSPDMIFLDINMPKMDGLTALIHIRANEVFAKVPIILLSSNENPAKVGDAYYRGATLYVCKPNHYLEYISLFRSLLFDNGGKAPADHLKVNARH